MHSSYRIWEFTPDEWQTLSDRARDRHLGVLVDVFEPYSLTIAHQIAADGLKVHSTNVTNPMFLERVAQLRLPVLIGTGGTTEAEVRVAVDIMRRHNTPTGLMHGFQAYPTADADTHLRRIVTLAQDFVCPVGFAGHADGGSESAIWQNLVALGLGCSILETHMTLDRDPTSIDYHSSLLPDRFAQMVAAVRSMETALGSAGYEFGEAESKYRATFKAYIVASRDLPAGHVLTPADFAYKRATSGLLPSEANNILGRTLIRGLPKDTPITVQELSAH